MSTIVFAPGLQFDWNSRPYMLRRRLPDRKWMLNDSISMQSREVTHTELLVAYSKGEISFPDLPGKKPATNLLLSHTVTKFEELLDLPKQIVEVAQFRLSVIKPLIENGGESGKSSEELLLDRISAVKVQLENEATQAFSFKWRLSLPTVRRWCSAYKHSGHNIRSLLPEYNHRGGEGKTRIDSTVETLLDQVIEDVYFNKRENTSIDDIYDELAVKLAEENGINPRDTPLAVPCRATIAKRLNAKGYKRKYDAKFGKRLADQETRAYNRIKPPKMPLDRVEIDSTKTDLIVIDDIDNLPLGRMSLTLTIDVKTRQVLGLYLGFEPPSALTVMECLRNSILPKDPDLEIAYGLNNHWDAYGVPKVLVCDNGKEFTGQDLEMACLDLSIDLQFCPVQKPFTKPYVERFMRTISTFLKKLPGTTFSNMLERKSRDYKSEKLACIMQSDAIRLIHKFVVDIYSQEYHRGLNAIPAKIWEKAIDEGFTPSLPESLDALDIILCRSHESGLNSYGIEFEALIYQSPELADLRERMNGTGKVKIKYDPNDISFIYVHDPLNEAYIRVPAKATEYVQGLSLWKHRVIRRYSRHVYGAVDHVSLGKSKREIRQIVENAMTNKKLSTRAKAARFKQGGPKPEQPGKTQSKPADKKAGLPAPEATEPMGNLLDAIISDDELLSSDPSSEGYEIDDSLENQQP